jgi:nuclear pore complex protein Nup88
MYFIILFCRFVIRMTLNNDLFSPIVKETLKRLEVANDSEKAVKQIICIRDDICFVWNHKDGHILALPINKSSPGSSSRSSAAQVTKFVPTDTPLFDVERITVSTSGRWLGLWGSRGATALELPRRSGKNRQFVGISGDNVTCHSIPIAERFFMCNPRIILQQASWHPGSAYDGHLMILSSDNHLRIFNLDGNDESGMGPGVNPEQTLPLSSTSASLPPSKSSNSKSFFGQSSLTVRGSLGETGVSFAFAPPVVSSGGDPQDDMTPNLWPIFILCGDGSVYCMVTGIGDNKPVRHQVMGPLAMLPEADDNYGNDSCAILCLHPMISSPPILVIATSSGTLYHCIVLHKDDDDEDDIETASQISDWSSSMAFNDARPVDLALHVYESVELELSLAAKDHHGAEDDLNKPFDYPILLHVDPTSPSRYYCSHKAGLHSITLPMVAHLAELTQRPNESLVSAGLPMQLEQASMIEHMVCTQMSSKTSPSPILGLAVSFPPSRMTCLLSDFTVMTLSLSSPSLGEPKALLSNAQGSSSPLKKASFQSKEPFDKHIAQILQRTTSHPLMKASSNVNISSQECYEILARSTKVLREEYLLKLEKARREIEKRTAGLEERKAQQHKSLAKLAKERFTLRDNAAQLSERYCK